MSGTCVAHQLTITHGDSSLSVAFAGNLLRSHGCDGAGINTITYSVMSSHSSYPSARRSPRRGERSSRRRYQPKHKEEISYRTREESPSSSLWEKIVGFFGGKKKGAEKISSGRAARRLGSVSRQEIRKPELVEVTSPRIYVGNLSFDATESDLFELFNGVGSVQNVEVVCHRQTHRSKGFAFVQMQTVDEARRAVSELHDKEYMGRKLVVSGAKALEER